MAFLVRIYRIVPLIAVLLILALVVYFVARFKFPSPRAKQIVINLFVVLTTLLNVFFLLATLYAFFDNNLFGVELFASFLVVTIVGQIITMVCNHRFLQHYPQYLPGMPNFWR